MNISLTPEMNAWITQKINSGMYKSPSELIREGIRLLKSKDDQHAKMVEELREELLIGIKQLDAGNAQPMDHTLVDKIKRDARKQFIP